MALTCTHATIQRNTDNIEHMNELDWILLLAQLSPLKVDLVSAENVLVENMKRSNMVS